LRRDIAMAGAARTKIAPGVPTELFLTESDRKTVAYTLEVTVTKGKLKKKVPKKKG